MEILRRNDQSRGLFDRQQDVIGVLDGLYRNYLVAQAYCGNFPDEIEVEEVLGAGAQFR